ncbi:MAG: tyrosine-type recombinase/integrase [Nanopusillaceae archaeon]
MRVEPIRNREDIERIKALLRGKPRDYSLFVVGINTGLRISDLLSLRYEDVYTPTGEVRESVAIVMRKTRRTLYVALNEAAREALALLRPYVRPGSRLWPYDRRNVWRRIHRWVKAAGVNVHVGTHTLRKTWAYHALRQGVPIEIIAAALGHSSPSVTRAYIGITDDEVRSMQKRVIL